MHNRVKKFFNTKNAALVFATLCFANTAKADMFTFSNLRYIFGYMGKAVGTLIIGFTFELGLRYIFGICLIFLALQMTMALYLIKMRKNEEKWLLC